MFRAFLSILALLAILMIVPVDTAAQCAMCKAVVTSNEGQAFGGEQAVGRGLNRGILFLLAIPYLLIFVVFRKKIKAFMKEFASAQG